jgi:hypothetical protein
MKLYNDQRNAQVFNLFIYLLLPYMFRAFFKPIFRGRCTNLAVVQVSWVWCQNPGADTIPSSRQCITLVIIQSSSMCCYYQKYKQAKPAKVTKSNRYCYSQIEGHWTSQYLTQRTRCTTFRCCRTAVSTFHPAAFFTFEGFTWCQAYLYRQDERALHANC